jgi:acetylornithine deacetylase/succinyl-diaminopimelate desuccinylase-like protein
MVARYASIAWSRARRLPLLSETPRPKRKPSRSVGSNGGVAHSSSGSGPMAQVCDTLGIPVAGFGSGNAASANHAPNENIAIVDYVDHIRAFGRFLDTFAGRALV